MATLVPKGKILLAQDGDGAFMYDIDENEISISCFHRNRPPVGAHVALYVHQDDATFPPYLILPELAKYVIADDLAKVKIIGDVLNWSATYMTAPPYYSNGDVNPAYLDGRLRFNQDDVEEEILRQLSVTALDTEGGLYVEHLIGDIEVKPDLGESQQ